MNYGQLVKAIDRNRGSGADLQENIMQCTRQAIGEIPALLAWYFQLHIDRAECKEQSIKINTKTLVQSRTSICT